MPKPRKTLPRAGLPAAVASALIVAIAGPLQAAPSEGAPGAQIVQPADPDEAAAAAVALERLAQALLRRAPDAQEQLLAHLRRGNPPPAERARRAAALVRQLQAAEQVDAMAVLEAIDEVVELAVAELQRDRGPNDPAAPELLAAEETVRLAAAEALAALSTAAGADRLAQALDLEQPTLEPDRSISPF